MLGDGSRLVTPRQVEEELGIPAELLELVVAGRPQAVDDGGRRFLVHPFLFRARPSVGTLVPRLNWENDDWSWVAPRWVRSAYQVQKCHGEAAWVDACVGACVRACTSMA